MEHSDALQQLVGKAILGVSLSGWLVLGRVAPINVVEAVRIGV